MVKTLINNYSAASYIFIFMLISFLAFNMSGLNVHAQESDAKQEKLANDDQIITKSVDSSNVNIDKPTHPTMYLSPDKSELLHLDRKVASIIVGNPRHASVIADSDKVLVIVPREPGATHFTAIDTSGEIIMQRHVIVASPKKDYIRIKRACTPDNIGCKETSIFYCPDTCHEINTDGDAQRR